MNYSKIPLAQTVVTLCKWHGVEHVVISPGSRSAPLTISFTHDQHFKCYSIIDERCAAFFALGIAQQTNKPVVLVCTSGSALLNYYPAISEAYYSNIPLVVLSADRPKHLVDIGDGQTINQKDVFGAHVHYSANLKLDIRDESNYQVIDDVPLFKNLENKKGRLIELQRDIQSFNESEIQNALYQGVMSSGPVHINVPFDEPLYERVDELSITPEPHKIYQSEENIDEKELKSYAEIWSKTKRKMILIGVLPPNSLEKEIIEEIAADDSILVFTEATSNIHHNSFFPSIDQLIAQLEEEEFEELQPEILLTIGGMVVSKKIKAFLRTYKPAHHWHLGLNRANDTFFCLEKHFQYTPNTFFKSFLSLLNSGENSSYRFNWLNEKAKRLKGHDNYLKTIPFSDFTVFDTLLRTIPHNSQLQVGNSSAIRYTQLFQLREDITVFCNRGTSGIDGSTSTAVGAAVVSERATVFITGDLSFFYDSNALWNNYIPNSFRIIVINNEGGGIFRILPGHKNTDNFDTYFETKHSLNSEHICKMYGFEYYNAYNQEELDKRLTSFYAVSEKPKLLEIFTPSRDNDSILLEYFKFIK